MLKKTRQVHKIRYQNLEKISSILCSQILGACPLVALKPRPLTGKLPSLSTVILCSLFNKETKLFCKWSQPFKPAQSRLHKELKISSCCDVGGPKWCNTGSNLTAYLLPLPDKNPTTSMVKRDKTSRLDRNHHQNCSRLQRTLLVRKD